MSSLSMLSRDILLQPRQDFSLRTSRVRAFWLFNFDCSSTSWVALVFPGENPGRPSFFRRPWVRSPSSSPLVGVVLVVSVVVVIRWLAWPLGRLVQRIMEDGDLCQVLVGRLDVSCRHRADLDDDVDVVDVTPFSALDVIERKKTRRVIRRCSMRCT